MNDYISKKGIQKALIDLPADLDAKTVQRCIEVVHNFPAADVRENKQGEWEVIDAEEPRRYGCSICKLIVWYESNYCPCCGAIMNGGN